MTLRNVLWPVTEGEVLRIAQCSSFPTTETPAGEEVFVGCDQASTGISMFVQVGTNALRMPTLKTYQVVAPTVNDDILKGFLPGSSWLDTLADKAYTCLDNSAGAAIWKRIAFSDELLTQESFPLIFNPDPVTGPSEIAVGDLECIKFKADSKKSMVSSIEVGAEKDLDVNPELAFHFMPLLASTAGLNVRFELRANYITPGQLVTKAPDEILYQTVTLLSNTADQMNSVVWTLDATKMAIGDRLSFKLSRMGGDPLDTFNKEIAVVKVSRITFAV